MSTLQTELQRLYQCEASDGRVRALVLELARPADWSVLSVVWRGVQADWQWPAPAIAVSGIDAYQLWFSLAEPVDVAVAASLLQTVRARYLGDVAPARLRMAPTVDGHWQPRAVPALQPENGQWSAFVAPDLAAIFSDEPWLDVQPSEQAQAGLLSQLEGIKPVAVHAVLAQAQPVAKPPAVVPNTVASTGHKADDPKRFLQEVMADTSLDMRLRVDAAIALLPYGEGG